MLPWPLALSDMSAAQPRLRDDLLISKQETREETFFVVKDPATRRFFRFREAEYCVARHLDGETSLETVRERVAAELGADPEPKVLDGFVAQLRRQGLLAPEDGSGRPAKPTTRFFGGNAVWFRVKAFDPDGLFNWLHPKIPFFFTPGFVALAIAVILTGLGIVLSNQAAIGPDLRRLWGAHGLVLIWTTIFGVTILHEFAHGLTCKHFGGEVHELGFLLIYGGPAFYCNVSDSWLFPEKSKRLWVMAAGGFFELFVWGLAAIVWRVAEPGTWLGAVALVIVLTSGVRQFFNLNPLIKLDGYYLLSDWLEIPNLRGRAFQYVLQGIKRFLGFAPPADGPPTPRERWIFVTYGIVAITFSYWLLTNFVLYLGRTLTDHYQGWGFLVFATLANLALGNPLKKVLPAEPARLAAIPRRVKTLVALAVLAIALVFVRIDLTASGDLKILPAQNGDVRAPIEGLIERVYVDEGAHVAAGDTIVRLAARDDAARLAAIQADISAKQSRLQLLRAGPQRNEVEVARLALNAATEHLRYASTELQRLQALTTAQAASRVELEQAQERVSGLTNERDEAQARLDLLLAGTRPESLATVEHEISSAVAERQRLEDRLAQLGVTAPHAGVITTPKLRQRIGEFVKAGDLIAKVYGVETVRAEIAVPEREIGDVRLGQRGALRLRAFPERAFEGRVTEIAPAAEVTPAGERIVRVTIEIPNDEGVVKPEMSGFARIYAGKRPAIDVLTRRFRRFIRVEFWSWW
ncbi:MAG TPA: efflux RND transporter periplasmic adaptor subunit [Gemmatimonadales bacterium]|nr:efflux RND transporter periplasmic adaptor subunit [Gemmatimonadales bacterium]